MQLNLTRPLQILQWSSYIYILVLVKTFVIFPIAVLLFNDFYLRLLPTDSSQWLPVSKLEINDYDSGVEFYQKIQRIPVEREMPLLLDNGIPELTPLREHIPYKLDLDINFFCSSSSKEQVYVPSNIVEVVLEVYSTSRKKPLIFQRSTPILCMTVGDTIAEDELYRHGPSRLSLFRKEWLNRLTIHDKINIEPEDKEIKYVWTVKASDSHMMFSPESGFRFRINFEQGLRNMMLRWRKITYVVGIIVFDCAITSLFVVAVFVSFYSLSEKFKGGMKKD